MLTTLKRINAGSAFRVGFVLYGLLWAIFGLIFVVLQGALLNSISTNFVINGNYSSGSSFAGVGILSLLCFYGVGIVAAAVGGGIAFAVLAWCYNLAARWVGGLCFELQTEDTGLLDDIERDLSKRKGDDL